MKLNIDTAKILRWLKYLLVAILTANSGSVTDVLTVM